MTNRRCDLLHMKSPFCAVLLNPKDAGASQWRIGHLPIFHRNTLSILSPRMAKHLSERAGKNKGQRVFSLLASLSIATAAIMTRQPLLPDRRNAGLRDFHLHSVVKIDSSTSWSTFSFAIHTSLHRYHSRSQFISLVIMAVATATTSLISLPNELLTQICEEAGSQSAFYGMIRVSRTFSNIADRPLYTSVATKDTPFRKDVRPPLPCSTPTVIDCPGFGG
jgi:hypothetical protein